MLMKSAINSLMEMVSIFFMENIMRRSTLTAAQIFENARKRGMLRRFTSQGRTLEQVKVGLSAKLRQSSGLGNSGIAVRQKNGINLYSV